jgi:hypothetical protein
MPLVLACILILFNGPLWAHAETLEVYSKASMLFGKDWVAPGLVIGVDAPVGTEKTRNYFKLGGEAAFYYQARTPILDLSFTVRPIYPISVPEGYGFLNVYVQLSAGPTTMFNTPVNWGYHAAVIPGVRYILDKRWGVFGELGYSFHTLIANGLPNRNISAGVFNAGVTYEF